MYQRTREILKKEIFRKMEQIEDKNNKMFHEMFPEIEKDIWDAIDNGSLLVPIINKLNIILGV